MNFRVHSGFVSLLFLLALHLPGLDVCAQSRPESGKLSLYARYALKHRKGEVLNLWIRGSGSGLAADVVACGGRVRYQSGSCLAITIPAGALSRLMLSHSLESIDLPVSKGRPLLDQVMINSDVTPVHNGDSTLLNGYTGKGVVLGLVDTGIELVHPDFLDSLGRTRVLALWDQTKPFDTQLTPQPWGYGQAWDSAAINAGQCTHQDVAFWGHGTNVAGIAAGNGNALNDTMTPNYHGMAPDADIVVVANDFWAADWPATVADAVDYIFHIADSLGEACVINMSIGDYLGSHDGLDPYTLFMDSLVAAKSGRMIVCAAGNAGSMPPFHLGYNVTQDTSWTWFLYNSSSALGVGAVFFELWADTADFGNVSYAVGADKTVPNYSFRGRTAFANISQTLNTTVTDSIVNNGKVLAYVDTWAEEVNGRYHMQVALAQPDSSQYSYRFITTGTGHFDVWSSAWLGLSDMPSTGLPDTVTFPDILRYRAPDSTQSMVGYWACSDHTITVANYYNRNQYIDVNGTLQVSSTNIPGKIHPTSSWGPSRTGIMKPDIAAAGGMVLTAGTAAQISALMSSNPDKVAQGGYHQVTGGTSMASPQGAGTVALLFEQCPDLYYTKIRQELIQSARSDSFATSLPNIRYGNGKLDAFHAALLNSYMPLVNTASSAFCPGDSIQLSLSAYPSVAWNTGDSMSGLWVSTAGNYSAMTTDSSGCMAFSDTVQISAFPPPQQALIIIGSNPVCPGDSTILSVNNGYSTYSWSDGSNTSSSIMAPAPGSYWLTVTDSNGCSTVSDTALIDTLTGPLLPTYSIDSSTVNTTTAIPGSFQWYCTDSILSADTLASMTADYSGLYWFVFTDTNGCSIASDTFFVQGVGIDKIHQCNGFRIYPVPDAGHLFLTPFVKNIHSNLSILDATGKTVYHKAIRDLAPQETIKLDISFLEPGIYLLYLRSVEDASLNQLFKLVHQ